MIVLALASQVADWRDLTPALDNQIAEGALPPPEPEPTLSENPVVIARPDPAPVLSDERPSAPGEGAADAPVTLASDSAPPVVSIAVEAPVIAAPQAESAPLPEIAVVATEAPLQPSSPEKTAPETDAAPRIAESLPAEPSPLETAMLEAPETPTVPILSNEPDVTLGGDAAPDLPALAEVEIASEPAVDTAVPLPEAPATQPGQTETIAQAAPSEPQPEEAPMVVPDTASAAPEILPAPAAPESAPVSELPVTEPVTAPVTEPEVESASTPEIRVTENPPESEPAREDPVEEIAAEAASTPTTSESALPGTVVRRLPSIGDGVNRAATDLPAATAPETESAEEPIAPDAPAMVANAINYEAPANTALMTVILIHQAGETLSEGFLQGIGLPLTFAVPAYLPDAAAVATRYRDGGAEVVLIPDLPPRATAQDVEVALSVTLDAVPVAVALMDSGPDGFQSNRDATASVLAQLAQSGHGVITWSQGFNSAQQAARREGIPSGLIYREIDAEDAASIARVLDQSAFRARQEGGVVTVGPATETVLESIAAWAEENSNAGVALAPVSAVLGVE
jgi:polysaccharide deacetylase 2 family uncharacterized protein YibQ